MGRIAAWLERKLQQNMQALGRSTENTNIPNPELMSQWATQFADYYAPMLEASFRHTLLSHPRLMLAKQHTAEKVTHDHIVSTAPAVFMQFVREFLIESYITGAHQAILLQFGPNARVPFMAHSSALDIYREWFTSGHWLDLQTADRNQSDPLVQSSALASLGPSWFRFETHMRLEMRQPQTIDWFTAWLRKSLRGTQTDGPELLSVTGIDAGVQTTAQELLEGKLEIPLGAGKGIAPPNPPAV
jgi:hypothetical protein